MADEGTRFTLRTRADQLYSFECRPQPQKTNCNLRLLDETTLEPYGDNVSTQDERTVLFWKASKTGHVVLEARSSSRAQADSFQYAFDEASDDAGNSVEEARPLPSLTDVAGFLEVPTDEDMWRFPFPQGHILSVFCDKAAGGWPLPVFSVGTPENPTLVWQNPNIADVFVLDSHYEHNKGGDVILSLFRLSYSTGGGYRCRLKDLGVDDHPDVPPQATQVQLGEATPVSFDTFGDRDVLAVDLLAGHTYNARTSQPANGSHHLLTLVTDEQGNALGPWLDTDVNGSFISISRSGHYFFSLVMNETYTLLWDVNTKFRYTITDVTPPP